MKHKLWKDVEAGEKICHEGLWKKVHEVHTDGILCGHNNEKVLFGEEIQGWKGKGTI